MAQKLLLAGKQKAVPAYYAGQPTHGAPDHYETIEEAHKLRQSGKASAINRGKAILIKGARRPITPALRSSVKQGWKVIGQTPRKNPMTPGFPHWSAV